MTRAICIRCGAEKFGAWTNCPQCRFIPHSNNDRALSLALTDHNQSPEQLQALAMRIRGGEKLRLDPATEQAMLEAIRMPNVQRMLGSAPPETNTLSRPQTIYGKLRRFCVMPEVRSDRQDVPFNFREMVGLHVLLLALSPLLLAYTVGMVLLIIARGRIPVTMTPWWRWLARKLSPDW